MGLDLLSALTNSHKQIKSINESNLKIIAETFNNFFVTTAGDIDSRIIHTDIIYKYYLQYSVLNLIFLKPAFKKKVTSVINETKTNTSTGPNQHIDANTKNKQPDHLQIL